LWPSHGYSESLTPYGACCRASIALAFALTACGQARSRQWPRLIDSLRESRVVEIECGFEPQQDVSGPFTWCDSTFPRRSRLAGHASLTTRSSARRRPGRSWSPELNHHKQKAPSVFPKGLASKQALWIELARRSSFDDVAERAEARLELCAVAFH
jgi:hypothetical protein